MFLKRSHLLVAIAFCAVLYGATRVALRVTPQLRNLPAETEGSVTEGGGWYPGEPFRTARPVRAWGTWTGADENTGLLTIGPFPAPSRLRFGVAGYPTNVGIGLYVELVATQERVVLAPLDAGEKWHITEHTLPPAWKGQPVKLLAIDYSKVLGGWIGITEPVRGGRGDRHNAFLETLTTWAINALLLGSIYAAAVRWLATRACLAPHWLPLGAGAVVALCGYVAFWLTFLHPHAGTAFSAAILLSSLVLLGWRRPPANVAHGEVGTVLRLMAAMGFFHLALLHLFPTSLDFYTLAANRFREALPSDNMLPHAFADRLYAGLPVRNVGDAWLSSDRPPLQTGWQLLTWPVSELLNLDRRNASGTAAVWFQLLWVAAAYGLLRTFSLTRLQAAGWVAALGLSGFFLQNTVYTWPKLSAGAFACGAFAHLLLAPGGMARRQNATWAGLFAALAWLSHGGVAFSFVAVVPWAMWRAWRGEWRNWGPATAIVVGLTLPWFAYQKIYDPPANRLFKWHLAGQTQIDQRGTWQTVRESYAKIGWREAWDNKVLNFHGQVLGDWRHLADFSHETMEERRTHEFFHTARALTWWPILAFFALGLARHRIITDPRHLGVLSAWLALTIVAWCLLMFGPYTAAIHQGSYAMMIALFVLCSIVLARGGRRWLAVIAVLQAVTLGTTWGPGTTVVQGSPTGLPVVVVAAAVLGWFILRATREAIPSPVSVNRRPEGELAGSAQKCGGAEVHNAGAPVRGDCTDSDPIKIRWEAVRAWWMNPRVTAWALLALAAVMFLRKPHTLLTPQLWAEDGSIFVNDQDEHGLGAFFSPYMGYVHALPRIVAWLAAHLFDPLWWPTFYNAASFLIWLAVLARFLTPRFALPGKPWLILAFLVMPHNGEVFFNTTNLQWLTCFVLIQQMLIAAPQTRAERASDFAILTVVGMTGPFVIAYFPLFVWRWWRTRTRHDALVVGLLGICALVQVVCVLRFSPPSEFQSVPFRVWEAVVIVAHRLLAWPVLGRHLADHLSPAVVGLGGTVLLLALVAWALRPHPRRLLRAQIISAAAIILLAGLYRARPDAWIADNVDLADRYFYIPRVLLAWLLIWEFDATLRWVANLARVFCLLVVVVHIQNYTLKSPRDLNWAAYADSIRQGKAVDIPTLPESWIMHYRGQPKTPR